MRVEYTLMEPFEFVAFVWSVCVCVCCVPIQLLQLKSEASNLPHRIREAHVAVTFMRPWSGETTMKKRSAELVTLSAG